jgi:hypothetical protein
MNDSPFDAMGKYIAGKATASNLKSWAGEQMN